MRHLAWFGGALLLFFQQPQLIRPAKPDEPPFWQRCDTMQPIQRPDDGSTYHVCIDPRDQRWEIVDRPISKECRETTPADKEGTSNVQGHIRDHLGYQHFMCTEQYELMVRPEPIPQEKGHAP